MYDFYDLTPGYDVESEGYGFLLRHKDDNNNTNNKEKT